MYGPLKTKLDDFTFITVKHFLTAFQYGDPASNKRVIDIEAKPGDSVATDSCGGAICIVNEFKHPFFSINDIEWVYEYSDSYNKTNSLSYGMMLISDTAGMSFQDFLKNNVAEVLGRSVGHLTFNLTSTLTAATIDGAEEKIELKPLIFKISDITESSGKYGRLQSVYFTMDYNSTILLPQLNNIPRMTVSSSDGDASTISNFVGSSAASSPYSARNAANTPARAAKLRNVPTMGNLRELTDSVCSSINEKMQPSKQILQTLLGEINQGHSPKVLNLNSEELPLEYKIQLDPEYQGYIVDNRNLPFEQPKIDQDTPGITGITFANTPSVSNLYNYCMKMSKKVGDDVIEGFAYRINTVSILGCNDKIENTTRIKKIVIPRNEVGLKDTGDGAEGNIFPIEYFHQKSGLKDTNIFKTHSTNNPHVDFEKIEVVSGSGNAAISLGDREDLLYKRGIEARDFFKAKSSGNFVTTRNNSIGLEDPVSYDNIDIKKIEQYSNLVIETRGNPDFYNDLARSPHAVVSQDADGATHYEFPELLPMYMKVIIEISKDADRDPSDMLVNQETYYYTLYYHIVKVMNMITINGFSQKIFLARTDDIF